MNNLELHALFQAEENAVQQALKMHALVRADPNQARLKEFPALLRDVFELSDDALCDALQKHIAAGADIDATPSNYGVTAFQRCFADGKLAAMRVLLLAGAKTRWTADQTVIALGEVPTTPETGKTNPFLFACSVGNLKAAVKYLSTLETGHVKKPKAVIAAVDARAADVVEWLLDKGFDPNAEDDIGYCALERAVNNDDIATAEVLLSAGAAPFGSSEKDYTSPVEMAHSEPMRVLFVRHGVNPAKFNYATNPESVALSFLPEITLTQPAFEANRSRRVGQANPERFIPTFWYEQMRTGRYSAPKAVTHVKDRAKPVWSFSRFGRSATVLPGGRLVLVGGEHEDHYDSDFCIYADVTVLDGKGGVDHFIYPEDVFPPTDFHTATLIGDQIWLIGSLGYPENCKDGVTQVLLLDLADFSINSVQTAGEAPGWIHRHRAAVVPTGIILTGGKIGYRNNDATYLLNPNTLVWKKC